MGKPDLGLLVLNLCFVFVELLLVVSQVKIVSFFMDLTKFGFS